MDHPTLLLWSAATARGRAPERREADAAGLTLGAAAMRVLGRRSTVYCPQTVWMRRRAKARRSCETRWSLLSPRRSEWCAHSRRAHHIPPRARPGSSRAAKGGSRSRHTKARRPSAASRLKPRQAPNRARRRNRTSSSAMRPGASRHRQWEAVHRRWGRNRQCRVRRSSVPGSGGARPVLLLTPASPWPAQRETAIQ